MYRLPCECSHHNGFLTERGYELAQRGVGSQLDLLGGVDRYPDCQYLDNRVSVSGLRRDENKMIFVGDIIDEQHRRFLNGS